MKIFYFSDSSFLDMKQNFENSFKDDFEKRFFYLEKVNLNRDQSGSGCDIWKYKTEMIIEAIKNNMDEVIVISDIDIIFYKPIIPIINTCIENKEIVFQKEKEHKWANIGFMAILCNQNTFNFWSEVLKIINETNHWDQEIVNELIFIKNYDIKSGLFPHSVWNWSQGGLNKDLILHHANCISTKEGKYEQMEYVKNFMLN